MSVTTARSTARDGGGLIQNVQVLRGVAAITVIFFHLDILVKGAGLPPVGGCGVDIFFVISGFIMVYTTLGRPVTPWSFMVNRITRIVPLYWAITLAVFFVAFGAPTLLQATTANIIDLIKSLFFVAFVKSNGLVAPTLFVGWSLDYEMFFYVLFALGLALSNRKAGVGLVILSLIFLVGVGGAFQPTNPVVRFYTNPTMLEFTFGMMIGLLHSYFPSQVTTASKVTVTALACSGLFAACALPVIFPDALSVVVCGIPATLLVGGSVVLDRWGWTIKQKLFVLMGNASYSIYLTHPFVTAAVQKITSHWQLNGLVTLVVVGLTVIGTCWVGVLVHHHVEQPLTRLCKGNGGNLGRQTT